MKRISNVNRWRETRNGMEVLGWYSVSERVVTTWMPWAVRGGWRRTVGRGWKRWRGVSASHPFHSPWSIRSSVINLVEKTHTFSYIRTYIALDSHIFPSISFSWYTCSLATLFSQLLSFFLFLGQPFPSFTSSTRIFKTIQKGVLFSLDLL